MITQKFTHPPHCQSMSWAAPMAMLVLFSSWHAGYAQQSKPVETSISQTSAHEGTTTSTQATQVDLPRRLDSQHLPNVVQLHERVISGGLPEGEAAFAELAAMQIKTIISVDGAKPDVELAEKYGMRYVHLPHGYDGIPSTRVAELAKAVRDLEGPIYIHCHHGKHRSPAAAGAACVAAGLINRGQATELLKVAGTGQNYLGLFAVVEQQVPLSSQQLDELEVDYRPSVPVPPMAEAMVELEHTFDNLEKIAQEGWNSNHANSGDRAGAPSKLEPEHQATLLQEHFRELMRTPESMAKGPEFDKLLQNSEKLAKEILERLNQQPSELDANQLTDRLNAIGEDCKKCHQHFRDNL